MQDLAAAAAGGVHSPTLGSREGPGDAILFHRRDGELLIILVRRLWSRTGLRLIVFFRGGGQGGSPGGSQFSGNTAHRERIGCSGGQRPDHGIARIDALAFFLDAAFHELPFIGRRPAHRIPLKGQRGLRGAVEGQPRRRGGSRRNGVRIFLIPTGNQYQQGQQTIDPNCFHDIFHIRASPRSAGPCPSDRSRRRLR